MPNAYIKKIKQKSTGDIIYPESKTGAIYMPDNITTLDGYLGNTDISTSGKTTISGIIGGNDISSIGDGTITGALNQLNTNLDGLILQDTQNSGSTKWTWNVYKNGFILLWGQIRDVRISSYAQTGPFFNYFAQVTFPSRLTITDASMYDVYSTWYIGPSNAFGAGALNRTVSGFNVYCLSTLSGTQTCNIGLYVPIFK